MGSQASDSTLDHWILGARQFGCSSFAASGMYSLLYLEISFLKLTKLGYFITQSELGFLFPTMELEN